MVFPLLKQCPSQPAWRSWLWVCRSSSSVGGNKLIGFLVLNIKPPGEKSGGFFALRLRKSWHAWNPQLLMARPREGNPHTDTVAFHLFGTTSATASWTILRSLIPRKPLNPADNFVWPSTMIGCPPSQPINSGRIMPYLCSSMVPAKTCFSYSPVFRPVIHT